MSPITGKKVDNAATVIEHSVDGEVVARYYVDEQGRTVQAEGKLDPSATYTKKGVTDTPDGYESGRDHRGHLIPERSAADQESANQPENVIAEHGRKSNQSEKRTWGNAARDRSTKDPGSWSVHEPNYDGDNPRPTSVDHSMYDSNGSRIAAMNKNIPNPDK